MGHPKGFKILRLSTIFKAFLSVFKKCGKQEKNLKGRSDTNSPEYLRDGVLE